MARELQLPLPRQLKDNPLIHLNNNIFDPLSSRVARIIREIHHGGNDVKEAASNQVFPQIRINNQR